MKLRKAATIVKDGYEETLSHFPFPSEQGKRLRTDSWSVSTGRFVAGPRSQGTSKGGESALMLVSARVRPVASTKRGKRAYLNMECLREQDREQRQESAAISRKSDIALHGPAASKPKGRKILDRTGTGGDVARGESWRTKGMEAIWKPDKKSGFPRRAGTLMFTGAGVRT